MTNKLKIAVLISGRGSNLQALIDATSNPTFPAEIVLVLSNKPDAAGLKKAEQASIPSVTLDHKKFSSREDFDKEVTKLLEKSEAKIICMAGFMRLLSEWFVNKWHNKLINIHPSLLPSFKGLHSQKQALEAGVKLAGCTVHFVRKEMDAGPIIIQSAIPVFNNDTEETLSKRILEEEHKIYPQAIKLIAENNIKIINEIVKYDKDPKITGSLAYPRD